MLLLYGAYGNFAIVRFLIITPGLTLNRFGGMETTLQGSHVRTGGSLLLSNFGSFSVSRPAGLANLMAPGTPELDDNLTGCCSKLSISPVPVHLELPNDAVAAARLRTKVQNVVEAFAK